MASRWICVFCGSRPGARPRYAELAVELGAELARRDIGLVYGGASVGLMGLLADSALAHGGQVAGVIPQGLVDREIAHPGLTDLHVVQTMHERKVRMTELSDAFVALPGGLGTLDELFEIATQVQLGLHRKPIGVLDAEGYYDHLLAFLAHAAREELVERLEVERLVVAEEPATLLNRLTSSLQES